MWVHVRWLGTVIVCSLLSAARVSGQCTDERATVGDLGVGMYHCVAGSCGIYDGLDRRYYTFSVEPQVWKIRPGGPASGRLRDRDVIVSVDGVLVTTARGGRMLANLNPGQAVRLTIRRHGVQREVTVPTGSTCAIPMLIWTRDPTSSAPEFRTRSPDAPAAPSYDYAPEAPTPGSIPDAVRTTATLGLLVSCSDCGWYVDREGVLSWKSMVAPVIAEIELDGPGYRAGLRPGDTITHVDGHSILTPSGGRRVAALRPGEKVSVTFVRAGRTGRADVTAAERIPEGADW